MGRVARPALFCTEGIRRRRRLGLRPSPGWRALRAAPVASILSATSRSRQLPNSPSLVKRTSPRRRAGARPPSSPPLSSRGSCDHPQHASSRTDSRSSRGFAAARPHRPAAMPEPVFDRQVSRRRRLRLRRSPRPPSPAPAPGMSSRRRAGAHPPSSPPSPSIAFLSGEPSPGRSASARLRRHDGRLAVPGIVGFQPTWPPDQASGLARQCARLRLRAGVIPPPASPTSRSGIRTRDTASPPSRQRQQLRRSWHTRQRTSAGMTVARCRHEAARQCREPCRTSPTSRSGFRMPDSAPRLSRAHRRLRRSRRTGRRTSTGTTVARRRQQTAHQCPCSCRKLSAMDHRQRNPGPAWRQRHDGRLAALDDVGHQLRRSPGQPRCQARQCTRLARTRCRRRLRRRNRSRTGASRVPDARLAIADRARRHRNDRSRGESWTPLRRIAESYTRTTGKTRKSSPENRRDSLENRSRLLKVLQRTPCMLQRTGPHEAKRPPGCDLPGVRTFGPDLATGPFGRCRSCAARARTLILNGIFLGIDEADGICQLTARAALLFTPDSPLVVAAHAWSWGFPSVSREAARCLLNDGHSYFVLCYG